VKRERKKEESIEDLRTRVAQLTGTISRVYGILRLEGEDDRWGAVEDWCKEQERKINEKAHKNLDGGNEV
jgi:hypothetical protein